MLPYAMRWNLDATVAAHARMAREIGIEGPMKTRWLPPFLSTSSP
jgi:hypothetical protein